MGSEDSLVPRNTILYGLLWTPCRSSATTQNLYLYSKNERYKWKIVRYANSKLAFFIGHVYVDNFIHYMKS